MMTLPSKVRAEFLRLKKANSKYIEIKHINKYYFVYQSTSKWDKEKKRPVKIPLYLGRITNAGQFIPGKRKKPRSIVQQVQQQTNNTEQQQILDEGQRTLNMSPKIEKRSKHEQTILTALSMNGRIPLSVLGKMVGLKETAVSSQVKKLERIYDIKYLAEIDTTKLGYLQFIITVKFLEILPKIEELKTILSNDPRIQLALISKGDIDLTIYALAKDGGEINILVFNLREKLNYKAIWNTTPVNEEYGHIPPRKEFLELLKDKLLIREYAVLKELLKDGKTEFTEIDRLYGFDNGRSQYSYYRLREKGIIRRTTISMRSLPIKYIAIIFEDIIDFKLYITKKDKALKEIISDSASQINKYLLVEDASNPDGGVLFLPIFKDGELESAIEKLTSLNLGINTRTYVITSILIGDFCYRAFDNDYSIQNDILIRNYGEKQQPKLSYEETGRGKREHIQYNKDIRGLKPEIT
jgi:DNA-binding Lrp family transcriptional regulator